jgi:hypothetical protein
MHLHSAIAIYHTPGARLLQIDRATPIPPQARGLEGRERSKTFLFRVAQAL